MFGEPLLCSGSRFFVRGAASSFGEPLLRSGSRFFVWGAASSFGEPRREPGAGTYVGHALEASGWEDIVGIVDGNRGVSVYTDNKFFRDLVWRLLEHYLGPGLGEEKKEGEVEG